MIGVSKGVFQRSFPLFRRIDMPAALKDRQKGHNRDIADHQ
jgi:hypothetical protein